MDTIEEPMDSFQSRLRTAMQMRNMSVNTLSKKSVISSRTIYIYLNPEKYHRESCPGSNNLEALAVALDVSMDWLWGRPVALMSWIPTSERLPEKGGEYLVSVHHTIGAISVFHPEKDTYVDDVAIMKYYGKFPTTVRAWMPLPEAYKPNNK